MAAKKISFGLINLIKKGAEQASDLLMEGVSYVRDNTEKTRYQLKEALYNTSDQVLEKAEVTRKSVKFRMAILEIEHHLNRLYPQIGKITCDLAEAGKKNLPKDKNLMTKIELAEEYRQRLSSLKEDLRDHQKQNRPAKR